jgi:hypothetical protein
MNAMAEADIIGTGWEQPLINTVATKVALLSDTPLLVETDGIVGANIQAGPAPAAFPFIEDHDAVFSSGNGLYRAGFRARGIITVFAHGHTKDHIQLSINLLGPVFPYGNKFDPVRGAVFLLARHLTGLASPAVEFIDEKGVVHRDSP